jgi:hypothetical protein
MFMNYSLTDDIKGAATLYQRRQYLKPDVNAKTDVFTLGLIIYTLIFYPHYPQGRHYDQFMYLRGLRDAEGVAFSEDIPEDWGGLYSEPLLYMMWACLEINPERRASVEDVIWETRYRIAQFERTMGPFENENFNLAHRQDQFPLGKKYRFKKRKADEDVGASSRKIKGRPRPRAEDFP